MDPTEVKEPPSLESTLSEGLSSTLGDIQKRDAGNGEAPPPPQTAAVAGAPASEGAKLAEGEAAKLADPTKQAAQVEERIPTGLSGELKAKWAELPPEVRKEFVKRENDFHNAYSMHKAAATFGEQMFNEVKPYEATLRAHNVDPAMVVREMLQGAYVLNTGSVDAKARMLINVAKSHGVSVEALNAALAGGGTEAELPKEFVDLRNEVQRLRQEREQQQQSGNEAQYGALQRHVVDFANQTQLYPHFETLRPLMAGLLYTGQATSLIDAYEKAQWAHPQVRNVVLASQQQIADTKRKEEAAKAAAEAAKAASVNVRGTPSYSSNALPITGTMEETMRETYRSLNS